MSTLVINKKSLKTWLHTDSVLGSFIISKFYFNADGVNFQIVEQGQSKRVIYAVSDITIVDDTDGGAEYGPYGTITELSLQLETLKYPAFYVDGSFNSITGLIEAGTNVTITGSGTESDPYVINSSGGGATPDLQAVTDEGATTTNAITVQDTAVFNTEIVNDGNRITSKDTASGNKFWEVGAAGDLTLAQYSGADLDPVQIIQFNSFGDLNQIFRVPDKPTGDYTFATTDDITGGGYTVVSSNQTAVNDTNYTVVANATFTDPTPTEGKGYVVYVRNGTATIGGTGYAVGSLVFRVFHSGAWSTREYKSNLTLDTTPTDGSTNGVESNGVFDALALKSNVNRSETFIFSKANGTFGSHTGNTTETVILTSTITGGVFEIGDWMNLMYDFSVTGTAGTKTIRFRAGTTGTTADSLIGSAFFTAGVLDFGWSRERLQFKTGNILSGIANNYTAQGFDIVGNTAAKQSTSLNPSNNWILSVTVQLANSADTVSCDGYVISRVKSF